MQLDKEFSALTYDQMAILAMVTFLLLRSLVCTCLDCSTYEGYSLRMEERQSFAVLKNYIELICFVS